MDSAAVVATPVVVRLYVRPPSDSEPEPPTVEVPVRLTMRALAELESAFDGIMAPVPIVEREPVLDEKGQPVRRADGSKVIRERQVGVEPRPHYGLEAVDVALRMRPTSAIRDILAIVLHGPSWRDHRDEVADRMIPSELAVYSEAIVRAWTRSWGVDPQMAAGRAAETSQDTPLPARSGPDG